MKLGKLHIFGLLGLMLGGFLLPLESAFAAYNPEDVTQMSAAKFWAEVNNLNPEKKEKDYIICGSSVCDPETQKCVVKEEVRLDRFTQLFGAQTIRGAGSVANYEYRCVTKTASLEAGWSEASEGDWVKRRKVRVGGWFSDAVKERGYCAGGSNGGTYCLAARNGMTTVNYNQADTSFRGCEVLPVKLYNGRKCFFCPLFTIMYKVAGDITEISFNSLGAAFALVLALGMAIWVAVQTLSHVSSLTKQDAPKFLTGLIKQSYKVLIAFLLLQYSSQIFTYGVVPVLKAGLDFGDALLDERYTAIETDVGLSDMDKMEEKNPGIIKRVSTLTSTAYYNGDLYLKLDNFVVTLQRNIAFMQGVGSSLICIGTNALMLKGNDISFRDGFVMTIQGVLLAGFGFLLAIAFAFYLVDAVVQMGIVGALMPFLIACWPFKLTSKYANTGWSMLLNSAFVFALSGLVLSVSLNLIDAALNFTATEAQTETYDASANGEDDIKAVNVGGLYNIAQAINSQNEAELARLTDMSTVSFLILLFCCIFGFKFLGRAGDLAGKFASGALKPIAPSIATMGGSAAKSFALKATQATREAAWEKIKDGGRAVASLPGRAWSAMTGNGALGGRGRAGAGGGASAKNGVSENGENLEDENDTTMDDNTDDTIRISENDSANAQNVRPRAASTGQFNPRSGRTAPVNTARLNEASIGKNESNQRAENSAARKSTPTLQEERQLERARQSGRRRQAGKARNTSQKGRSRKYKANRLRRRR